MYIYVTPVAKPRMTRSDKWNQRPIVMNYRAFKDELRLKAPKLQENVDNVVWLTFMMPMPKSWSLKKKKKMVGQPHQQTPDIDNLVKAFLDATMKDDKEVYEIHANKMWSPVGSIFYGEDKYARLPKTTKKEEKGQSSVKKQKKALSRVGRQGNPRMRGVSPRVRGR